MLITKKTMTGAACSRTTLAVAAAMLLIGGTATAASARSGHHSHPTHHAFRHLASRMSGKTETKTETKASEGPIEAAGRVFSGVASFYGNESGRQTASGVRFDQNLMTCAHRSLPFGTKLRVTHGDRSVVVTVTDRGPYVKGRVLDLTTAAARAVGITSAGIGHVTAQVIG